MPPSGKTTGGQTVVSSPKYMQGLTSNEIDMML